MVLVVPLKINPELTMDTRAKQNASIAKNAQNPTTTNLEQPVYSSKCFLGRQHYEWCACGGMRVQYSEMLRSAHIRLPLLFAPCADSVVRYAGCEWWECFTYHIRATAPATCGSHVLAAYACAPGATETGRGDTDDNHDQEKPKDRHRSFDYKRSGMIHDLWEGCGVCVVGWGEGEGEGSDGTRTPL